MAEMATASEFVAFIVNVIRMGFSENKPPDAILFDLWKIFYNFYQCKIDPDSSKDENFQKDLELIDCIYVKIENSYTEVIRGSDTLSEIMGILIKYRRDNFYKLNRIQS